jgi:hypothetical protein
VRRQHHRRVEAHVHEVADLKGNKNGGETVSKLGIILCMYISSPNAFEIF